MFDYPPASETVSGEATPALLAPDNSFSTPLTGEHWGEVIDKSAVSPDIAAERGYRVMQDSKEARAWCREQGFSPAAYNRDEAWPMLVIPMYRATGEIISYQIKPAVARPTAKKNGKIKAIKYESPRGRACVVDVPPFTRQRIPDTTHALWVTEGIKKTDSLVSHGRAAIGLTGVFNWRNKLGSLGDWEDIPLRDRRVYICFDSDARHKRGVMLAMVRFGAWLTSKGAMPWYTIVPDDVDGVPVKGVDDYFAEGGTVNNLIGLSTNNPPDGGPADAYFTDASLTEEACSDVLEGTHCWTAALGWMRFSSERWTPVDEALVTEQIRSWVLTRFTRSLEEQKANPDTDLTKKIEGWRGTLSKGRMKGLVDLSRGIVHEDAADFDQDKDILVVPGGYVYLPTGEFHEADPSMLVSKRTGCAYEQDATDPLWDMVLEAVPAEVREYLQDRYGQALTGHTPTDGTMVVQHGGGENGKTTFVSIVKAAIGDYGTQVSDRVLLGNPDNHPTEFMSFRGARFAYLEETPEEGKLNVQQLKKLVDTPEITARLMRQDSVTFGATHALFVNTNNKPVVKETDHATWRRLALVVFPYRYVKRAEDIAHPDDRLGSAELADVKGNPGNHPGIVRAALAWMVQGAIKWYQRGRGMLPAPQRVVQDTRAWRAETDLILGFSMDCLEYGPGKSITTVDMVSLLTTWLHERQHKAWSDTEFAERFKVHELARSNRVTKGRLRVNGSRPAAWFGVGRSTPNNPGPGDEDPFFDMNPPTSPHPMEPVKSDNCSNPDILDDSGAKQINVSDTNVNMVEQEEQNILDVIDTGANQTFTTKTLSGQGGQGAPVSSEIATYRATNRSTLSTLSTPLKSDETETEGSISDRYLDEPGEIGMNVASPEETDTTGIEGVGSVVGLDLETHSADEIFTRPHGGFVRLTGLGVAGQVQVNPGSPSVARLEAATRLVGHNLALFDLPVLDRHHGIPVEQTIPKAHDLRFCAFQADPPHSVETKQGPSFKSYSLEAIAERYLPGEVGKSGDGKALAKEFGGAAGAAVGWGLIPVDDPRFVQYCRDDVELALRLADELPMTPYVEREMKIAAITARATLEGFRVDMPALEARVAELREQAEAVRSDLAARYGFPETGAAPQRTNAGKAAFKAALIDLGFTPRDLGRAGTPLPFPDGKWPLNKDGSLKIGKKELATALAHAVALAHPAVQLLLAVQEMNGLRNNAANLLRCVTVDSFGNARVHPRFEPFQATGRWSVLEPGLTVLAKDANSERRFLIPDEGHVLISIDLDQADARGVAAHSQDTALLALLNDSGRDFHSEISDMAYGRHDDPWRAYAKTLDFGWLYGRGVKGMVENTPGVTMDAALRVTNAMAENFPRAVAWQREIREQGAVGLLDNGFGRKLRCTPGSEYTQAPALIGQSTTREFIAEGLLDLARTAPEMIPMLRVIVHDEVVLSVPETDYVECARIVQQCMSREWAPPGASNPVRITAGGGKTPEFHQGLGRTWAECYKSK